MFCGVVLVWLTVCIDRKNKRRGVDGRVLLGENETGTNCVLVVEFVTRIQLDPIRENVAIQDARRRR